MNTKLKKNDPVVIIAGKDKGKTGRILRIDREKGRVLVEGINMVKKAQRQRSQNESGGIIEKEASIAISNVMFAGRDSKPSRLGYRVEGGEKVRYSKKTGDTV